MIQLIIEDISEFFHIYAYTGLQAAFAASIISIIISGCIRRRFLKREFWSRQTAVKAAVIFLLAFYIYNVIGITFLSRSEDGGLPTNLRLFSTFSNTLEARKSLYENILLFVPYGILLYALAKPFRKLYVSLAVGALSSFLIEIVQKFTHLGRFETDDILTNSLGMLAGYGMAWCVWRLEGRKSAMLKCPQKS